MRCSACRRELEGPAISTNLLCKDDESKIHGNDAVCPVCDQVLSKRRMMFYIRQKELEIQYKMKRIALCWQKCEAMQEKFSEKLEQVHTAYQNLGKRCQMIEQEIESLSKEKQELQEKFSENSRPKRKVDEMYDPLRSKYQSLKRSTIQHANNFHARNEPDSFTNPTTNMMDSRGPIRKGPREDVWPARQNSSASSPF
ncbi:hypothetical protein ES288_D01G051900v1 [Gossypium darwinii]|uniref:RING-type domain-containing protein n=2 Tax=Gossypium TaxID=3633 RepID=A0A0D2NI79_GOSRA|nr:hypothetical protein B456_002G047100 [Gossypium raimondii]TYG82010.1 hypothetical protein ES288_D01G051900v1 [Gossypium darwinii]